MNVLLLLVALHFGFLASFCQGDGSFSALDSPSSTEWDEYVTSQVSCSEDDEWWSDSSCSFCRCKCETRESSSGVSETTCVSRCYDYTSSSSYSAIYEAADYCGYSCDYYRELRIDYSESSCDCDSITYSCSNYNDSSTGTEMPSSTDIDRTSNEVKTTSDDDDASSTDMPSTSNDDVKTTTIATTTATDDNTEDYSTTDGRTETQNTDLSMSSTEESDDDDDYYSTTSDDSSDTSNTDVLMSSTEEGTGSDDDDDDDSIYNDGESETVPDSDADYSYLYIKLGLQVTRIWDSRSEVWDILRKALRDVMSDSPDYDADTTNIYFLYWDAYKVDDDSSTTDDVTTGSTSTTNDDEAPTTTTISVTSVDSGGRRRARALLEDSTRNSEEVTVQFYFSLAVYFGNSDDAQDWYDYLTSLGDGSSSSSSTTMSTSVTDGSTSGTDEPTTTDDNDNDESFGTRYVGDCDDEARTYDTNGWGTITLTEAYIGLYDSDGTVIEETSYSSNDNSNTNTNGNSDTTVPSSSSGNSGNSIYGNVNSVLIVAVFAGIVRVFVW